jgi:predicted hydrocarbon binding protein
MERKDFIKSACSFGVCGCIGASLLTGGTALAEPSGSQVDDKPDWRIDFMQNRFRDLVYILNETIDEPTYIKVLNQLGAKCGAEFAAKYKNDPEGFFTFAKGLWVDSVDYDKENGIIRVNEKVRKNCNCPFVRGKDAPSVLCNCSLGTQKKIYESLFGRPVSVNLEKSILKGDERCSFVIQLL